MTSIDLLTNLLGPPEIRGRFYGVTMGIVTNNGDEENLGRVKVKFPWLSDSDESYWARVLTPMAGNDRGIYFLPEVNDEVLVAFEQGDINFPYILGGLWNGKDKPPESPEKDKEDSKKKTINKRTIKSRSGHIIRLDDTKDEEKVEVISHNQHTIRLDDTKDKGKIEVIAQSGHTIRLDDTKDKEKIEVIDKTGKNSIIINTKDNSITIESKEGKLKLGGKGIEIISEEDIKVTAKNNLDMKTDKSFKVNANGSKIETKQGMHFKASKDVKITGNTVSIN
ncbi:MAG: phage tail protein [Moorea sp. SIO3I7]|uniref:phage baseplate assembly protein V n=1 Tax=Moorena sp. SIO3I8 TaxID=2607833 RepID=UPI0013C29296|nr:phage baseplate assembly protein V [Moorena sp. SIO3I8]NEO03235.1 phage tail protein [Moorena sp. SIO3I7]NEO10711.1 phage tail protein [Moorena sp. SIO3I8]